MANEVQSLEGKIQPGEIVALYDKFGQVVGSGFFNPNSFIRVRLYSTKLETLDSNLIEKRILRALKIRKELGFEGTFRAFFSESDWLPGLIVDKYAEGLVVQILTYGMEVRRNELYDVLVKVFKPSFIYEKSSTPSRRKEGLQDREELVYGEVPEDYVVQINGVKFILDIHQKTGLFLDQRENYLKVLQYVEDGETVLDAFSYTGGFTLHILKYRSGVERVVCMDQSERALQLLKENVKINDLRRGKVSILKGDIMEMLDDIDFTFDTIILDPPAFTKRKNKKINALKGYDRLHAMALRKLKKGGKLITFSCAYHVSEEDLIQSVRKVAMEMGRHFVVVERLYQSKDHPFLLNFPESLYLKGLIFKEVEL